MRRNAIGILAALLLVVGAFTAISGPGGSSASTFAGACIRMGLVLGALWLAMPQIQALLKKSPRWLLSWFVGKNKPSPAGEVTKQSEVAQQPAAPPPPRPRRRSTAR
jgi:hypothetical protein